MNGRTLMATLIEEAPSEAAIILVADSIFTQFLEPTEFGNMKNGGAHPESVE